MKRINWSEIICIFITVIAGTANAARTSMGNDWSVLAFREDFNAGIGEANMPDPNIWVCNIPCSWWWVQGRTFFPSPKYHLGGRLPYVENGICIIEHHHYNPWHIGIPKTTFLGGQIRTKRMFAPNTPYRFEAMVRCKNYPDGLVTSFFLYGYDCLNSDEVDFEFVSKKTNDDVNYPYGDPIMTNPWNESFQNPLYVAPNDLNLIGWNTFRIYWYPDQNHIVWTWVDTNNVEKLLRTETNAFFVADEPMGVYFNFWAPTAVWQDAYDANLQPVSDPNANRIYKYDVNYIEIRVPEPVCGDVNHLHPESDQNYDCYVNMFDYSLFSGYWQKKACGREDCCGGADLNEDCIVDLFDLGILTAHWLDCTDPDAYCKCNP